MFGNRTEKVVTDGSGTTTTRFAYDLWNPAKAGATGTANSDIWAVFNGSGSLTSRQLQGDGIDQHFAFVQGSNAYWYLADHLNSIRTVLNSSGTVIDSIAYDGYGSVTSETNSADRGLYSYTGRELDVETNLQYNRARYYDAGTARWISQDPMGFDAGDSNLYRYVNNAPTNETDPSGLWPQEPGFGPVQLQQMLKLVNNPGSNAKEIFDLALLAGQYKQRKEKLTPEIASGIFLGYMCPAELWSQLLRN